MIDLDALRRRNAVTWKLAGPEPGLARPLLLAAQQPDRSLSLPEELPEAPRRAGPCDRPRRAADRGLDPRLGRAALAAVGPPLPVIEQVLRGRDRPCLLGRGIARPRPGRVPPHARRPRLAVPRPRRDRAEGLADDDGRRDDHGRARPADGGDLQAVQPQEMAGPAAQPVPAVARLAVVAGGAGPRQPRHPDAAEPRVHGASAVSAAAGSSGSCRTRPTWSRSRRSRPSTCRPTSTRSCRRCRPTSAGRGSAG